MDNRIEEAKGRRRKAEGKTKDKSEGRRFPSWEGPGVGFWIKRQKIKDKR